MNRQNQTRSNTLTRRDFTGRISSNTPGAVGACVGMAMLAVACGDGQDVRPGTEVPAALPEEVQSSYAENLPSDFAMKITEAPETRTLQFDATGDHRYFPLTKSPKSYASKSEMVSDLASRLGETPRKITNDDGSLDGLEVTYQVLGDPLFEDRTTGLLYRVTEPVLALVGGASGIVNIAGEATCIDPDEECAIDELASYLEPIGEATAPTHRVFGNVSGAAGCTTRDLVCVQFHTFFNQTWFPFPYARHGSNVSFVKNSALPSTRLTTGGFLMVGGTRVNLETVTNTGANSVETSTTCAFSTSCAPYNANTICGFGSISDPDINLSNIVTGNGPLNNPNSSRCP